METKNDKTDKKPNKGTKDSLIGKRPKKLNKFGEWLMSDNKGGLLVIKDMKAVLK